MALLYPQILNLDELNVFLEDSQNDSFFIIEGLPNTLTLGKHFFKLAYKDKKNSNHKLKEHSKVLFEFKDSQNNVIFSDISEYDSINGSAVCFVDVREQRAEGYYDEIANGIGTFTIVGELDNVPERYKGAYNVRLTIPIEIRKNLPNVSPILFQNLNNIQVSSSFSESIDLDSGDSNYKRSYINISASHLETVGGRVDKIELSYRETRAKNNEFKVLSTYPLSSSVYESNLTETGGLNPISDLQKFPMPREIRRNGGVEYKLRFINANGDYAQDISQNNVDVIVTGSISNYTGSPVIIETTDNLVTGSGAFVFGTDINNGIRLDFKPAGSGKFKEQETLEFTKVTAGSDTKTIYTLSEKGGLISDIDSNKVSGSDDASLIGSINSNISSSELGAIIGSSGSQLIASNKSLIIGGQVQKIHFPLGNEGVNNGIFGGSANIITASNNGVNNSAIVGGTGNFIERLGSGNILSGIIVGGRNNRIKDGFDSIIVGGFVNVVSKSRSAIIGGTSNKVIHEDSVIIGMSNKTSDADDTVYVQNLDVAGSLTVNQITSSIVSSSIIFSSGSNIFGDAITDTHTFNGHITASGNISASGLLYASASSAAGNPYSTLMIDTGSGRFYYTGSYGGGGSGGSADNLGNHTATQDLNLGGNDIFSVQHITASGNISSSGALSKFGEVVHLEGTDPRLKLKAKGANHPGIEWHEDSTRKWVLYNDPDASQGGNDNLTFKNASDTELMELDQDGILYVGSKITHLDDANTFINFTTDDINIQAGGVNMMDFTQNDASQDEITFNEAGADLDVRIEGDTDTDLFFTNAGTDRVGIGTNSPSSKLQVDGDITTTHITASGNISSSGNLISKELYIDSSIVHNGDTDTTIGFADDNFRVKAGNVVNTNFYPYGTKFDLPITASGNISASGTSHTLGGFTMGAADGTIARDLNIGSSLIHVGDDDTKIAFTDNTITFTAGNENLLTLAGGLISASGHFIGTVSSSLNTENVHHGTNPASFLASAGDHYGGEIVEFQDINDGVSAGDVVIQYATDWRQADADAEATSINMMGVALQDGDSGNKVLIRGFVRLGAGHITDTSGDEGDPLYLSTTAGHVQFAAPSGNNDVARVVGYCVNEANDIIYLNPSTAWVKVSA